MICKEYRVFRLLPDGKEETVDFTEWASRLDNKHPIAKAY